MEEVTILGYVLLALITIIGFVVAIIKMTKPINNLCIAVQELRDSIKALRELSTQAWRNSYVDRKMERVPLLKSELEEIINN